MVIDQEVHDGFEGVGILVEFYFGVATIGGLLPILTALRKRFVDAQRGSVVRGYFVWISVAAYLLSVVLFWQFNSTMGTDDAPRIALWACSGSLVAIAAFVLGLLARGPGRILAVVQGVYTMIVWLPFFWGRVLLHLQEVKATANKGRRTGFGKAFCRSLSQ
jgi:hypothetical protein